MVLVAWPLNRKIFIGARNGSFISLDECIEITTRVLLNDFLQINRKLDTKNSEKITEEKIFKWFVLPSINIPECSNDWIHAFDQFNLIITGQMGVHKMWNWKLPMTKSIRIAISMRTIKLIWKFHKWFVSANITKTTIFQYEPSIVWFELVFHKNFDCFLVATSTRNL